MHVIALKPGSRIAGYEIKRVLGAGGFGITYEGFNPITRNRVAIKEFFPRGIVSRQGATISINDQRDRDVFDKALKKFEESTSKLCGLTHPNIVKVHDYIPGNQTGYMLMEYLEGDSVRGRLDNSPTKTIGSVDEMRRIYEPVLDALRYVHANNILHRDLSPDNVMIVKGGRPVLIDFGALRDTKTNNRVSTLLVAREAYAPFEQLSQDGPPHGAYTDIYTIAASMYECLSGDPPARAGNRLWGKTDPYVSIAKASKVPCPPQVAAAIDHALKTRTEDRPQSIDAFMAELGWGGAKQAGSAHTPIGPGASAGADETMAWNQARQSDQLSLYNDFLHRYPASRFADAARERAAMLADPESTQLVHSHGAPTQFTSPQTQYNSPPTQFAPLQTAQPFATEDAQWMQRIRANPNLQDVNQFLWRHPTSPLAPEARALAQSLQSQQPFAPQTPAQFGIPSAPGIPPQQFPGAGYVPPPNSSSVGAGAIVGVLVVILLAAGVLAYTLWPSPGPRPTTNTTNTTTTTTPTNPAAATDVRIGRLNLHIDAACNQRRSEQSNFAVFTNCATNKIADDSFRRQPNATLSQCVTLCSQEARCNAFDFEGNECFLYEEVTAVSNIPGTAGIKK